MTTAPAPAIRIEMPAYDMTPVSRLLPYALNSRTHSPRQIDMIAASIKQFGFTYPILTDGEDGVLAGHGRLEAAKRLGLTLVPTIALSHLSPSERRAYVIADNRLAELSGWDVDTLAGELGILHEEGFDLEAVGYDEKSLEALLSGWEPDMDKINKVEPDDAPLNATLKVKCPQEIAGAVEEAIKAAVAGFEGVEVG